MTSSPARLSRSSVQAEKVDKMKALKEMTSRELFCLLTGDGDVMQQAMLREIILSYKEKYPEKVGHFGEMDLASIVAEMTE